MMKKNLLLLCALCSLTIFSSCSDDIDDVPREATTEDISDFIYRGLNFWSIYKDDVPELANDFFESNNARAEFLSQFDSPEATFSALTSPRDRFSILSGDFTVFENALAGINTATGINLSLFVDPTDDTRVFGAIRYVVNGSSADLAGVERGMLFTLVDGAILGDPSGGPITNETNFGAFFAPESYTISIATFDEVTGFTLTGEEITVSRTELTSNPVHTVEVLDVEGSPGPVGYLHYTGFTNEFDNDLNAAFAQFQNAGVTDLVLDLRYNGGGSVETANDLCTMITGQFEGDLFITQEFNADRNEDFQRQRSFNNNLGSGDDGPSINSIGLERVFILTTERTASASELILSGLDPYIEIVQIGLSTSGKFEGSFLVYDAPNFSRADANPNHTYVMLPLTFRSVNAQGLTDYFDGFSPDVEIGENPFTYGTLGEPGEPFLDVALDIIVNGRRSSTRNTNSEPMNSLFDTEQTNPFDQYMIATPPSF